MKQYNKENVKEFETMPAGKHTLTVQSVELTTSKSEKPMLKTTLSNGEMTILDHTLVEMAEGIYKVFGVKHHSELTGKSAELEVKNDGQYSNVVFPMPMIKEGEYRCRIEKAEEGENYDKEKTVKLFIKLSGIDRYIWKEFSQENDWFDTEMGHVYNSFDGIEEGNIVLNTWVGKIGGCRIKNKKSDTNGKTYQNVYFIEPKDLPAWSEKVKVQATHQDIDDEIPF